MPLKPGSSNDIVSSNISELEHGKVVGKTRRKFGKKRAQKQAVAIALKEKRKGVLANKRTPRKHA
jgi:hypothetical protein